MDKPALLIALAKSAKGEKEDKSEEKEKSSSMSDKVFLKAFEQFAENLKEGNLEKAAKQFKALVSVCSGDE